MNYEGQICRAPMERGSFMLPVMVGCSYNACKFCTLFKHLKYRDLPFEQIEKECLAVKLQGGSPRKIFLGDGNAFTFSAEYLLKIIRMIRKHFPDVQMINMDATVTSVLEKSDAELKALYEAGVRHLYLGIESGLDDVLQFMKKDHTLAEAYLAIERLRKAGLFFDAHMMTGIAGHGRGEENALALAEFYNRTHPAHVCNFSLFLHDEAPLAEDIRKGLFVPASELENLQEDHIDRHGSVEVYHGLKRRLLGMARAARDFSETGADAARAEAGELFAGSYFDNDVLAPNGLAAAWLMQAAGLDHAAIRRAFASFVPLPHRMSLVAEIDGVRYVDDSKATSMAALAAGVEMAGGGVRLIAGGLLKGDDPEIARPALTRRVKKVYLIGQGAEALAKAWLGIADCEVCGTLDRAVAGAMREAARGETVLLSPGAASFDQFHSFGERGDVFAGLVKKEGDK